MAFGHYKSEKPNKFQINYRKNGLKPPEEKNLSGFQKIRKKSFYFVFF